MNNCNPYQLKNTDFIDKVDVVCPGCNKRALVSGGQPNNPMRGSEALVRFSCIHCGRSVRYEDTPQITVFVNSRGMPVQSRLVYMNSPCDPYFKYAVWYRINTKWGMLWAYNVEHLEVIEAFIADKLRSRNGIPMQNNSIASRLPRWVTDSKNREVILKLIQRAKSTDRQV